MQDEKIEEIITDPQKMLNFVRIFHQLLHFYDQKEMAKELEKQKDGTKSFAGLGDTVSLVLKDSNGKIKQEVKSN